MKRRSKAIIVSMLLAASIAAGSGVALARGDHGYGHGPGINVERMADRLDLSGEQRDAIRGLVDEARPALQGYHDRLRENHRQLRELTQADTADETAIRELANDQGAIVADMIVARTQLMRAIRAELTPEQQTQLDELMQQRHGRGKHHAKPKDE